MTASIGGIGKVGASTSSAFARGRAIVATLLIGMLAGLSAVPARSAVQISQVPLFLPQGVPGNLVLTPSVEWPTINVAAYKGAFATGGSYNAGLFDARFCYAYRYAVSEPERYFEPIENADGNGACTNRTWSGKFLNWATTQTIEPFRIALTGGNRVVDTATTTWIQKARQDGQGGTGQFPTKTLDTAALVSGYTPAAAGWSAIRVRIQGLGNRMRFTSTGNEDSGTVVPYVRDGILGVGASPLNATDRNVVYEVSMRVQVCKPGFLSSNCVQYGTNYKPEGLIQEYSKRLRYSAFGYLVDNDGNRDGAVLRARQKFVGPQTHAPLVPPAANAAAEWDATTGVLLANPNPADATASSVTRSGVINFINKFSEDSGVNHKSLDPVSEMYYAATRYLRNIGNVPEYSNNANATMKDNFPVITSWDDPIQYRCQSNVILGIGDVFTHRDKNLPGPTNGTNEPTKPASVVADTAIDVVALTRKVAELEGISLSTDDFTGRNNSAFIAGLAYDAHTRDQRTGPGMDGKQTVSTYWMDVREASGSTFLQPRARNQYWLAAKYGGFTVPTGYQYGDPLGDDSTWFNNGEILESGDRRPDNFFVASNPEAMISGLKQAFAKIAAELQQGSGAALGATSTRLEQGAAIFQATFQSGDWAGDLRRYNLNPSTGAVQPPDPLFPDRLHQWSAAEHMAQRATANADWWRSRSVYMANGTNRRDFTPANVAAQYAGVGLTTQMVNYLLGERTNEGFQVGRLRPRSSVLGAIINSQPLYVEATETYPTRRNMVYVGGNDGMLHGFDAATGAEVFAFVPKAAITAKLRAYTQYNPQGYAPNYFVDGELTAANVVVGGVERTYLVGTMGRGDPGAFALDITNPDNMQVVWDRTGAGGDIAALGNSLGKPVIAEIASGNWSVAIGNGPNSGNDRAALLVLGLTSPSVIKTVEVQNTTNNGLSAPVVWRPDPSGYFNVAYAGDLRGNVWKITGLQSSNPSPSLVFTATTSGGVPQPITAGLQMAVQPNSGGQTWIFFGTGRYLSSTDVGDTQVQTWYGIKDGPAFTGRTNLVQRQITAEATIGGTLARAVSAGTLQELENRRGWYMDLVSPVNGVEGERIVVPNIFQGLALVATTRIPNATDPCGAGSKGFVMAVDPFTGGRFGGNNASYFDVNGDGVINDDDALPNGNGDPLPNSGIGLTTAGSGVIGIGDNLYTSLDSGGRQRLTTIRPSGNIERVSWREVLLNLRSTP